MNKRDVLQSKFGRVIAVSLVLGLAAGSPACGDDPPTKKTEKPGAKAKPPPKKGGSRKEDESVAPADTSPPPPKVDFQDEDFVETEQNRDPFRPFADLFAARETGRAQIQRKVVLEEYSIDELKLVGIVSRINPAKAMVVDPTGQGHVVHRGDFMGKAERVQAGNLDTEFELNWRIDRIRDQDMVLVREDPSNPDIPSATRVLALRPEESTSE